jgi:hypothetical protein
MQMMNLGDALLVVIFRSARLNRRANLTAFCRRRRCSVAELEQAFEQLEARALISFHPEGERLTLSGLALGAALAKQRTVARPLAHCRPLAA